VLAFRVASETHRAVCSRHENLVRLFGWYVSAEGGRVCLVMELLPDTLARCGNQARFSHERIAYLFLIR
jgi:hypothetical protein